MSASAHFSFVSKNSALFLTHLSRCRQMPEGDPERNARLGVRARRWARAKRKRRAADASASPIVEFRVVSYNVLAQTYAQTLARALYRVGSHRLEWASRSRALSEELNVLNPDVLCVQEVEEASWKTLGKELSTRGLVRGAFTKREGSSMKRDGCAIFYRREIFDCEFKEDVSFAKYGLGENAACIMILKHRRRDDFRIVVANAHLLFNPKRGDVKVGQLRVLLDMVAKIKAGIHERGITSHCIVCGDFNFSPESPLYDFVLCGKMDLEAVNRRELSGSLVDGSAGEDETHDADDYLHGETMTSISRMGWDLQGLSLALGTKKFESFVARHSLKRELRSAYVTVTDREPAFTTCHSKFCGTNDYIWHSRSLEPTRVLQCPQLEDVVRHGKLPSVRYASDHVSIAADFCT